MKKKLLFLCLLIVVISCQQERPPVRGAYVELVGETMGTTYSIKYLDRNKSNYQRQIDSTLVALNAEVSTYIPSSTIAAFNESEYGIPLEYKPNGQANNGNIHFLTNLSIGLAVSKETNSAFQPTIMPIVNYWGFGYTGKEAVTKVDSIKIDSLMRFVGLDKIAISEDSIRKDYAGTKLDFGAIAKGYGVDLIAGLLRSYGIEDYFIEIGGDLSASGVSPRGDAWRIGITVPKHDAPNNEFAATAPIKNKAVATSGNYRNYYDVEGEKYGHTMNPYTGFPEKNNLLSASVFTVDCTTADAYATAFMVMGPERAYNLALEVEGLEAYFIIGKKDGTMETIYTPGLAPIFGD